MFSSGLSESGFSLSASQLRLKLIALFALSFFGCAKEVNKEPVATDPKLPDFGDLCQVTEPAAYAKDFDTYRVLMHRLSADDEQTLDAAIDGKVGGLFPSKSEVLIIEESTKDNGDLRQVRILKGPDPDAIVVMNAIHLKLIRSKRQDPEQFIAKTKWNFQ